MNIEAIHAFASMINEINVSKQVIAFIDITLLIYKTNTTNTIHDNIHDIGD